MNMLENIHELQQACEIISGNLIFSHAEINDFRRMFMKAEIILFRMLPRHKAPLDK